jgi:hypothetical protein
MIQHNTFTIIISYFHKKCTICWKHFVPFSHYSIAFEKWQWFNHLCSATYTKYWVQPIQHNKC